MGTHTQRTERNGESHFGLACLRWGAVHVGFLGECGEMMLGRIGVSSVDAMPMCVHGEGGCHVIHKLGGGVEGALCAIPPPSIPPSHPSLTCWLGSLGWLGWGGG